MGKLLASSNKLFELPRFIAGKTLVATNGCFDILHVGHVRYLQEAKKLGDLLIVGVNSDASVRALNKAPNRPINRAEDRAEVLNALACVDYTFIFEEVTAEKFLRLAKPNIYTKGGDYNLDELPERDVIKELGCKVIFLPFQQGYSTTNILKKV